MNKKLSPHQQYEKQLLEDPVVMWIWVVFVLMIAVGIIIYALWS
jgi:hypothetical protein